jgi:hypothetical protein
MAAIPWKLALLSAVGSERLLQALQEEEEILYHPHEVSAWGQGIQMRFAPARIGKPYGKEAPERSLRSYDAIVPMSGDNERRCHRHSALPP